MGAEVEPEVHARFPDDIVRTEDVIGVVEGHAIVVGVYEVAVEGQVGAVAGLEAVDVEGAVMGVAGIGEVIVRDDAVIERLGVELDLLVALEVIVRGDCARADEDFQAVAGIIQEPVAIDEVVVAVVDADAIGRRPADIVATEGNAVVAFDIDAIGTGVPHGETFDLRPVGGDTDRVAIPASVYDRRAVTVGHAHQSDRLVHIDRTVVSSAMHPDGVAGPKRC